jgi:hypothetical protein
MSAAPSIKGTAFANVVHELRELVVSGKVTREVLTRRLQPADLAIIDQPIHPSGWYEIRLYGELAALMEEVAGGHDFSRQRGARSAELLLKAGIYQQLEYVRTGRARLEGHSRGDIEGRFTAFGRDLRLITTFASSMHNHSRWEVKVDPEHTDRWMIEVTEASAFPDAFVRGNEGFINRMSAEAGLKDLWRGERPRPDLIRYRMTRALR